MKKLVVFQTVKGGKFNNDGNLAATKVVEGPINAERLGYDIDFTFSNLKDIAFDICDFYGNDNIYECFSQHLKVPIYEAACEWNAEIKARFDALEIRDVDGELITHDQLGEPIVVDELGEELCTVKEYNSDEGSMDFDGICDTISWCSFDKLDEDQILLVVRDLQPYEYRKELCDNELVDGKLLELALGLGLQDDEDAMRAIIGGTWEDFIAWADVECYDDEEAAIEAGCDYAEIDNKYYAWI